MIRFRPPLPCLILLAICLAGANRGYAEAEKNGEAGSLAPAAAVAPAASAAPAAAGTEAAPATGEPPNGAAAGVTPRPDVPAAEPAPALVSAPVVADEPGVEHAENEIARLDAPAPAATPAGSQPAPAAAVPHIGTDGHDEIIGLLNLGASLTERGEFDAAEIALRQVLASRLAKGPDLARGLLTLARLYRKQGALTKAAAVYERYLKDYPGDNQVPDALLELGRTHRALGAPQLALSRFYSVINSTLKLGGAEFAHYQTLAKTAQFEIAETHFQQGDYAEANKFFSRLRLLDLAPADRARAHFKSAYALYLGKDFDGAVTTLHSFLEQWPNDENVPEARYLLSLSLRSLGRKQEALDETLALLKTQKASGDPKVWAYWQRRTGNQLANDFFQNGETQNALIIYHGLAALSEEPLWRLPITYQIGLCYERMRITDRAIAAYQAIVDGAKPTVPESPAPAAAKSEGEPADAPASTPVATAAPKPVSPVLTELARMAAWRLGQLNWSEQTENQLTRIFSVTSDPGLPKPPAPDAAAPNIGNNAASTTVNANPGNPPAAPPSL